MYCFRFGVWCFSEKDPKEPGENLLTFVNYEAAFDSLIKNKLSLGCLQVRLDQILDPPKKDQILFSPTF